MCFKIELCIQSYSERSSGVPILRTFSVRLTVFPLQGFQITHPIFSKTWHITSLDMSSAHAQQLDLIHQCCMTTELSLPSRQLATIEPTPPSQCFTVFSAVFLGAVSWKLPLTIPQSSDGHLNAASFDPVWMHGESATPPALSPRVRFPTRKRHDSFHSLSYHRLFAAAGTVQCSLTTSCASLQSSTPGFKCITFDLLATAAVVAMCVVMRREGKEQDRSTSNARCILHADKGPAAYHI